jgi:hypothetical protein
MPTLEAEGSITSADTAVSEGGATVDARITSTDRVGLGKTTSSEGGCLFPMQENRVIEMKRMRAALKPRVNCMVNDPS